MTVTLARRELYRIAPGRPSAVTIGVFDGVHRGHQHLVALLLERARQDGLASVALTFNPHPRTVLQPGTVITYLTSIEERIELLQALGLDAVCVLAFTSELAQLSPHDFLTLLVQELEMRLLVVGPDFALGRGRVGDIDVIRAEGEALGFAVQIAPLLTEEGEKVGSTAVREALAAGDLERVARLLGRPFSLRGPVVTGDRRGRSLGFPTANIALGLDRALPPYGIYVTRTYVRENAYPSCTSIGVRPTFHTDGQAIVETYVLDFDEEIYGEEIRIDFLHRLRDEMRFDTVDALIAQMRRDVNETREWFRENA